MFPLPYASLDNGLLYLLLGADVLLLAGGLTFGPMAADGTGRLPRPLRMALSAILVVAAFVEWRASVGTPVAGYGGWVLLGMGLGFLGDLIMAEVIPAPDRLIGGMLAFGLGHIVYVIALAHVTAALGLWQAPVSLMLWALLAGLGIALWHGLVQRPGGRREQNAAALVYSLLMATMNAFAIGLALRQARFLPLALGALLFLASDTVLGHWAIRGHVWKRVNDVVWITYNLGQMLIVYSVAAALNAVLAA